MYVLRMRRSTSSSGVASVKDGSFDAERFTTQRSVRQTRSGPMITPDQSYTKPCAV